MHLCPGFLPKHFAKISKIFNPTNFFLKKTPQIIILICREVKKSRKNLEVIK